MSVFKLNLRVSEPAKASFWFMICNILQNSISFITAPIFTRIMSESDYGLISVYTSWSSSLSIIVTLMLAGGVYNNAMIDFEEDTNVFTSSFLGLSVFSTLIFYNVYLVFRQPLNILFGLPIMLIQYMFLEYLLTPAFGFWMAQQKYNYKYKLSITISLLITFLNPIISFFAVKYFPNDKAMARIIFGGIPNLIISLILFIYIFAKGKKFFTSKYWKYALVFNIPLIPHYLASTVLSMSDRIMIAKLCGESQAGKYSIAYSCAVIISIIFSAINASWIPHTYKKLKEEKYSEIGKNASYLVSIAAVSSVGLILIAPELIKILAPPSYYEAIYVIPPVVIGMYYTFLYTLFANIEFYHRKTLFVMFASVIAAALNIGLNIVLIPIFGYMVAAYTTMLGYLVLCGMHYYFMRRIEKNKIYNMRFIIMVTIGLMIISCVIMFYYDMVIIRYLIITIICIIGFINKERLLVITKVIKSNK